MSTDLGYCQRCDDGSYEWIIPKDSEAGRSYQIWLDTVERLRVAKTGEGGADVVLQPR